MAKILIIDIETAPKLAYVWRFFKENVGAKQVVTNGHIMSYAAKWLGEDHIYYNENRGQDERKILREMSRLLDEADIVVAHNGDKFDIATINARLVVAKLPPCSPFKTVDTLKAARLFFRFDKNSLEYLAEILDCAPKKKHGKFPGFELWLACLQQNEEAWQEMKEYNVQDVDTLEEVYLRMRPWIRNHPNVGLFDEGEATVCPKCGSDHIHFRGYAKLGVSKVRRFRCVSCGGWGRLRKNVLEKEKRAVLAVNA